MNRLAALSFAVLLGSSTLGAQTAAPNSSPSPSRASAAESSQTVYVIPVRADSNCPVSMRAQHGSGGGLRLTRSGRVPAAPSGIVQRIHLSLEGGVGNARESAKVTGAKVTVHGTSAKWLAVPTELGMDSSSDIKRMLDITFYPDATASVDDNEGAATDMILSGFTSVQSITLDSLTYADGSIWTPQAGRACRVIPDPLMLVSSSR